MKTSIDLPDELYRQVKAKRALEGKTVREVATTLFAAYAAGGVSPHPAADRAEQWLQEFRAWGDALSREHPGSGMVDQLLRDRR